MPAPSASSNTPMRSSVKIDARKAALAVAPRCHVGTAPRNCQNHSTSTRLRSNPRPRPPYDSNRCCEGVSSSRSEEHTSELQSLTNLVCRLLLEKKKIENNIVKQKPRTPEKPFPTLGLSGSTSNIRQKS